MADITVTVAQVRALTENGAVLLPPLLAGGTINMGDAVYMGSGGTVIAADANASADATKAVGIAVESFDGETSVISGNPVTVCCFGPVSGYSSMTPGANVWVSDTVGRLSNTAGTFDRILGWSLSAGIVFVNPEQNTPAS
jgi:hypothetical protein